MNPFRQLKTTLENSIAQDFQQNEGPFMDGYRAALKDVLSAIDQEEQYERREFAARAMRGLLSNDTTYTFNGVASKAVLCADALIAELDKPQT